MWARIFLTGILLLPPAWSLSTIAPPSKTNSIKFPAIPQDKLYQFHQWADDQGIERKVEVQQDMSAGGGRGLIATQRIEPGEVVVKVPLKATLRLKHSSEYDFDDNWAGILARKLHQESLNGLDSPFASYVANLPQEAPLTPCRWNSVQRNNLQNSTFIELIQENSEWRKRQLMNQNVDYAHVVDYMKWLDLVCSRTLKGRDGSRQLVPLIDIANHAPSEAGGGHFMVDEEAVYLMAGSRGVNEGQPVTLDYGARNVDDFLLHYGFVPHRCVSDSVNVQVGDETVSISWNDIQGYRGHDREDVRKACSQLLESFPTTMQEDVTILNENGAASEAEHGAVSYRYAKKSLLTSAVGMSETASPQSAFAFL